MKIAYRIVHINIEVFNDTKKNDFEIIVLCHKA